ncbi:MAG: ATP-binding protein [Melioribacteraceae bacterium]|nr:ATP-binding protein [Melioribacteraceae bacterium]
MNNILKNNGIVLEKEFEWFYRVLETRIKLHLGHNCEYRNIYDIPVNRLVKGESAYADFIMHYEFSAAERIVILLAIIPYLKPHLLDIFLTENKNTGRQLTEFGGKKDQDTGRFIPTIETALFILAGDNLEERFSYYNIFEADHYFIKHNIITSRSKGNNEYSCDLPLTLSSEILDLITTGKIRKPTFSADFPAKLTTTQLDWSDLVLETYTMNQVDEILAWIRYGGVMLNGMGLSKKIQPGYRSLFYGPPGTGKTLTASLIGKIAGLDVYRIDLSLVVSKYIGETEKNLEKIFQQAEYKNWILFFDEADALFGKRTNITDAHDRFANQEVSYLLQRVEDYPGVVILASNMKSNIDEAFTRRFQSIIYFPMPKPAERLKLWKNAFSYKSVLEDKIKLQEIAANYELSGGSIMNVVRYSTLMSLKKNTDLISSDDLYEGIRKEFQKEGKKM